MKKFFLLILLIFVCSCENFANKPKDLLSQNKMAEIMAEMALNDQATITNPKANLEIGTRFILKKNNIKPDNFVTSYSYYAATKKIPAIAEEAQEIIKQKHPEAEKYINKKTKEDAIVLPISR